MIVVSDFDNTLYLRTDPAQFQKNLEAVQKFRERGHKFCLASGRSVSSLSRVWPEYHQFVDYIILDNGAICLDAKGATLFQYTIPKALAQSICQDITSNFPGQTTFVYYHSTKEWPELDADLTKLRCWTTDIATGSQILEQTRKYSDKTKSFLAKHAELSSVNWISDPEKWHTFVDIMSINAGKENAIAQLCSLLTSDDVVTIGDDTNDIGMLTKYDGYAMKHSFPEVLALINPDHVVNSVADLLYKFI